MARAQRHYIPGHVWHITHRCHKKEFLFQFVRDRHRWMQWLYETRKRYELTILDYIVTSNHIHLLVYDHAGRDVIPESIKLLAGRTGQEYNMRKNRLGAFWHDRYHATAVESGEHLIRCIVYIDLNMVRAGVVKHPSQWAWSGYNEIQKPRRKTVLINYDQLAELAGFDTFEKLQIAHMGWINETLSHGRGSRERQWTESVAVGSEKFIKVTKAQLGYQARGRKSHRAGDDIYQLRETPSSHIPHFEAEKSDIDLTNTYSWENFGGISA